MNLRVHHIRYPEVYGQEQDEDLITLCDECHSKVHENDLIEKKRKALKSNNYAAIHKLWADEAKKRDFLYGGEENMCSLNLLKESAMLFRRKNIVHTNISVSKLQEDLGWAHMKLCQELYKKGFSSQDIFLRTQLPMSTVEKYLAGDRAHIYPECILPRKDIEAAIRKYVEESIRGENNVTF